MTERTKQIRQTIATVNTLDREWRAETAGRDNLAVYLPWMPFSWPEYVALVAEALPEAQGDTFLDIGAGVGTKMMLAEEIFGLDVHGVERVPEYVKEARSRGMTVDEADALTWNGYGNHDIVFFNRPFFDASLQAQLEERVWQEMKPGAVVIAVNLLSPPPENWYLVLDDREVRRWIKSKP
jgi:trans-aconitate methyltransferase